jgi:hypothetical protein
MGLLQILRRVDASVTPSWCIANNVGVWCPLGSVGFKTVTTPNGVAIKYDYMCQSIESNSNRSVRFLYLEVLNVPSKINDALQLLPALDAELVAALRNLPDLQQLRLSIGSGTLMPQLAALTSLQSLNLYHYCLRGSIPAQLIDGLPKLEYLRITPVAAAAGATDPAGGLCGVSGTLPNIGRVPRLALLEQLDLSYNQLTGQLPQILLSLAGVILLQRNRFSGSIPGRNGQQGIMRATQIDLSSNVLQVTHLRHSACVQRCCIAHYNAAYFCTNRVPVVCGQFVLTTLQNSQQFCAGM